MIAGKVRALRKERGLSQAELARRLGMSQGRISELERGDGSFTAEQFLEILKLFSVNPRDFAPHDAADPTSDLQNALARLGASHLHESDEVLLSERLVHAAEVIKETLASTGQPRLVTALAPVLVARVDLLNFERLEMQLKDLGLARRFGWVVENTVGALHHAKRPVSATWLRLCRRAATVLEQRLTGLLPPSSTAALDIFDAGIRSKKTLDETWAQASPVSLKWRIATAIQPTDFAHALEASHGAL